MLRHFFEVGCLHEESNWSLTRIIHERFYCNRGFAAATSLSASFARPAGRLAPRNLDILFQVCLGFSGLRVPVSQRDCAISSRTVMNNAD